MTSGIPWLAAAYLLVAGSNLLLTLFVGNALGAHALGEMTMAVTVARLYWGVVDLGLSAHLTRAIAREPARAESMTSLFLTARLGLLALGVLVSLAAALALGSTEQVSFAFVAVAIGCLNVQLIYEGLFLAYERRRAAASLTAMTALAVILACAAWWRLGTSLVQLTVAYAAMTMLGVVAGSRIVRARVAVHTRWLWDPAALVREARQSWPIGASVLVTFAALRCSVFILGLFTGAKDIGAFAAAEIFVTSASILQAAVSNSVYSELSSSFRRDPAKYGRLFWSSMGLVFGLGVFVALVLSVAGGDMLHLFFARNDFELSNSIVPVLGWSTPALLVVHHTIVVFAATDKQHVSLRLMVTWLISIAAVQFPLIAVYGVHGAAWGLLFGRTIGAAAILAVVLRLGTHRGGQHAIG